MITIQKSDEPTVKDYVEFIRALEASREYYDSQFKVCVPMAGRHFDYTTEGLALLKTEIQVWLINFCKDSYLVSPDFNYRNSVGQPETRAHMAAWFDNPSEAAMFKLTWI